MDKLSVTPERRQPISVGYTPETQSIQARADSGSYPHFFEPSLCKISLPTPSRFYKIAKDSINRRSPIFQLSTFSISKCKNYKLTPNFRPLMSTMSKHLFCGRQQVLPAGYVRRVIRFRINVPDATEIALRDTLYVFD